VWLTASDDHRLAYEHYLHTITVLRTAGGPGAETSPVADDLRDREASSLSQVTAMAAGVVLFVAVGGVGVWALAPFQQRDALVYATAVGEQKSVTLSDGSVATLDTNSRIRVSFSDKLRRVDLLQGRSEFDVASDRERPFQAHTDDGMIMALGTVFTVRRYAEETAFTLLEGSAVVSDAEEAGRWRRWRGREADRLPADVVMLAPGETVNARSDVTLSDVASVNLDQAGLWKTGMLVLNGASLDVAVAELNRYSKAKVTLADDPALRALKISGRFDVKNPQAVVENMGYALDGLEIVRISDAEIRLEYRGEAP